MNCDVFATFYESVAKDQPIPAHGLGKAAVHKLHISPTAVERFTSSFVDSAVTAGLAEVENGQVVLHEPGDVREQSDETASENTPSRNRGSEGERGRVRPMQALPVVHQEWTLPAGAVVFEVCLDQPLPGDVFGQLGIVVQHAEKLAGRLRELLAVTPDD